MGLRELYIAPFRWLGAGVRLRPRPWRASRRSFSADDYVLMLALTFESMEERWSSWLAVLLCGDVHLTPSAYCVAKQFVWFHITWRGQPRLALIQGHSSAGQQLTLLTHWFEGCAAYSVRIFLEEKTIVTFDDLFHQWFIGIIWGCL